jgi:hypothetical protein
MFGTNDLDITLYFVGEDEDEAQTNMPFDSYESADSYVKDHGRNSGLKIYEAKGVIDFTTMEESQ